MNWNKYRKIMLKIVLRVWKQSLFNFFAAVFLLLNFIIFSCGKREFNNIQWICLQIMKELKLNFFHFWNVKWVCHEEGFSFWFERDTRTFFILIYDLLLVSFVFRKLILLRRFLTCSWLNSEIDHMFTFDCRISENGFVERKYSFSALKFFAELLNGLKKCKNCEINWNFLSPT